MQIVPLFNGEVIKPSDLQIRIDPEDRRRSRALVEETGTVMEVSDEESFLVARRAAASLKGMLDEIERDRKAAKGGFDAVGRSIQDAAHQVAQPVKVEQARILTLLEGYVAMLEAAKKEEERLKAEQQRRTQAEADRKVREAQEYAKKAEEQLRKAQGEIEQARHREELQRRENLLLQQQLEASLASEEILPTGPEKGLVPDGRVNTVWDFELVDVNTTVREGCWRLIRWDLDIRACQDSVRNQLELNPEAEPTLPGIKITKRISVSVKAASRIK